MRTLVVDQPLALHRCRGIDRLTARLRSTRLDHELAAGRPPEWSRLHAARAEQIVSLPFRETLAADWERLLRPSSRRSSAPLLRRDRVAAASAAIRLLAERLRAPLPVPARGVALASVLLTDGLGPLYNRLSTDSLDEAVNRAAALLDPAAPLTR